MKEKYDKFMEDMNLREEAWAYEDISWLENLTEKQYDEIFDMLLNNEDLEVIKRIIGK